MEDLRRTSVHLYTSTIDSDIEVNIMRHSRSKPIKVTDKLLLKKIGSCSAIAALSIRGVEMVSMHDDVVDSDTH